MQRFNIRPEGLGEINIDEEENGEWVRHDDVVDLLSVAEENKTLKERVDSLEYLLKRISPFISTKGSLAQAKDDDINDVKIINQRS